MLHMSKTTNKVPEQIFATAHEVFAEELGLRKVSHTPCCEGYEGGGGYVTISLDCVRGEQCTVDVESREWDYWIKQFLQRI